MSKSDKTIKRTFRLTLRAKRATAEFAEGLGVGVLASVDVTFKLPEKYSETSLALSIDDHCRQLVMDNVEVLTEEVTAEELPIEQDS